MSEKETLELLREAHREPIAEAHYAAVRARVLSQIAGERRPWRMWAYGFAAVAALAVILAVVGRTPWSARGPLAPLLAQQDQPRESPERPAGGPPADEGVRPTLTHAEQRRAPVTRGRRINNPPRVANLPHNADQVIGPPVVQPLMVKLVTEDPNVVIYWISGE